MQRKGYYAYCFVPQCSNTSITAPLKCFFNVPRNDTRLTWYDAVGKGKENVGSITSRLYCCEDHFAPEDMDITNYHGMGSRPEYKLKRGVLPSIQKIQQEAPLHGEALSTAENILEKVASEVSNFESDLTLANEIIDKLNGEVVNEVLRLREKAETKQKSSSFTIIKNLVQNLELLIQNLKNFNNEFEGSDEEKHNRTKEHSSSLIERKADLEPRKNKRLKVKDENQGPSSLSSEYHVRQACVRSKTNESINKRLADFREEEMGKKQSTKRLRTKPECCHICKGEESQSSQESSQEAAVSNSSQLLHISDKTCSSEDSEVEKYNTQLEKEAYRESTMKWMEGNSQYYLGISSTCYQKLIGKLMSFTDCSKLDILITLRKIRLNESIVGLSHQFGFSTTYISKVINRTVFPLGECLENAVFHPRTDIVRANVPVAFRANYSNVQYVIDCFEVGIEQPSNALFQSLSFSQYKHTNTLKFLISCTPDGHINFISTGFGGRITDEEIVPQSGFLEKINPNSTVMADRGFKHIDVLLQQKNCSLSRPPSVAKDVKMPKADVRSSKKIASLRCVIERVICRVREYTFLDARATFHHDLLWMADSVVKIACGLSNLQGSMFLE